MNSVFENPHAALKAIFGYDEFRGGQLDIINKVIAGVDVLAVMTTGGGKSLCYQIPALCMEGTTIVVSPLIALMKDQVERLNSCGVSAAYLNSSLSLDESVERINKLKSGGYRLFYVAPERLSNPDFAEILCSVNIQLFAIDEAHCISSWGNDFRSAYRRIPDVINQIELYTGKRIPRLACTATATERVREDIKANLQMHNPYEQVGSFDRPNIEFAVRVSHKKTNDVLDIIRQSPLENIIVYCATVSMVDSLYADLIRSGIVAGKYHGKMESEEKNIVQERFIRDEIRVMVATKAFGMGVDKSNINHVIHYHMPSNIEDYYQEAGRAGRDGSPSKATLLFSERDRSLQGFFIDTSYPAPEIIHGVKYALQAFDDGMPITLTYDQIASISPANIEIHQVQSILRILGDQGFLRLHNFEKSNSSPTIEIVNASIELDLDNLITAKKVGLENLNSMERFARTKLCRREFILNYFGEPISHRNCGNCDVCKSNSNEKAKLNSNIPDMSIRSCLELVQMLDDTKKKNDIIDLLLGIKSRIFERQGLDKLAHYGALVNWTKSDAERLISYLIESDLLYEKRAVGSSGKAGGSIVLSAKGGSLLQSKKPFISSAPIGFESVATGSAKNGIDNTGVIVHKAAKVYDHVLCEKIFKLRSNLAIAKSKPSFMIFSDALVKNIATTKPSCSDDLLSMGLTSKQIEVYGKYIIEVVSEYENSKSQSPSTDFQF
jgi:RecQ family ATP-dependent DNA helicase